jgi:hypothetical protein
LAVIIHRPLTKEYANNYDLIFRKAKDEEASEQIPNAQTKSPDANEKGKVLIKSVRGRIIPD